MSRGLDLDFLACFTVGHLAKLVQRVREDKDLDFQIRENYINIYHKGNSLLKLDKMMNVEINKAFRNNIKDMPDNLLNLGSTEEFIRHIPIIKDNISRYGKINNKQTLETEYEQLIERFSYFLALENQG